MHGLNCAKFGEDIGPALLLTEFILDIRCLAPFRSMGSSKTSQKLRPNFALFAACKNSGMGG